MRSLRFIVLMVVGAVAQAGCTNYQYVVIEPAASAQTIPRRGEITVQRAPLDYALVDHGESLGVRVANTTDQPILIVAERSYVVDPNSETHPLSAGTIAPRSYIAIALPPSQRVYRSEPHFGFGVGVGSYHSRGGTLIGTGFGTTWSGYHHSHYDSYTTIRAWRWHTGDIQIRLAAQGEAEGSESFEHEFIIRRERVD